MAGLCSGLWRTGRIRALLFGPQAYHDAPALAPAQISPEELANAMSFLREQLGEEELRQMLESLSAESGGWLGDRFGRAGGVARRGSGLQRLLRDMSLAWLLTIS